MYHKIQWRSNGDPMEIQWRCNGDAMEIQWRSNGDPLAGDPMEIQCLRSKFYFLYIRIFKKFNILTNLPFLFQYLFKVKIKQIWPF